MREHEDHAASYFQAARDLGYLDTNNKVTPKAVWDFTNGRCAYLAWVLHKLTGLPLQALLDRSGEYFHMGVRTTKGAFLDIRGIQTARQLTSNLEPYWLQDGRVGKELLPPMSFGELVAYIEGYVYDPTDYEACHLDDRDALIGIALTLTKGMKVNLAELLAVPAT